MMSYISNYDLVANDFLLSKTLMANEVDKDFWVSKRLFKCSKTKFLSNLWRSVLRLDFSTFRSRFITKVSYLKSIKTNFIKKKEMF